MAVLAKIVLLPFPVTTPGEFCHWLLRLGIVVAPDLMFLAALAALCSLFSLVVGRRRLVGRAWRCALYFGAVLTALYTIASVPMYGLLLTPFTARMISFVGGPVLMASSLKPYLPPSMVAAVLGAPLGICLLPNLARRFRWFREGTPGGLRFVLAAAALAIVYGLVCRGYVLSQWKDTNRWERRIAQSAHGVLLASCVEEALKEQPFSNTFTMPGADESDFTEALPARLTAEADIPFVVDGRRPKNLILLVLESVGTEYIGLYASKYDTTPNLDRLAAEQGLVFDNLYAQATMSCKSLICLSSSIYARPDWLLICRDNSEFSVPMISQALSAAGYRTCYAHAGYWEWKGRDKFLKVRGIDRLIGASDHAEDKVNSWGIHDRTMFRDVLSWIDQGGEQPFFVYAYTIETHDPYILPDNPHDFGVENDDLHRYLNAVRTADEHIGWLMEELEKRGLADSTVVAVTADHGEAFGQHGQTMHGCSVYEQTVHVPLVLLHPALRGKARRETAVGQHIDIAPTLLDIVGVPPPEAWQGRSLLSAAVDRRAYFCSVCNEVILGLRDGRWKYHFCLDSERDELFDLAEDPAEDHNLAEAEPERCLAYRRRIAGLVQYQRRFLARHGVR